jgi:hypothetical protein
MQTNLKYCAQHYLNQWIVYEQALHSRLSDGNSVELLPALDDAVKFFQVARNLPRKFDVGQGQERYEPLLREFTRLPKAPVAESDYVGMVSQFQESIGAHYGGRNLVSLASKLLWLRYRDPFIIYDSRVRHALRAASDDYGRFAQKWLAEFDLFESKIEDACALLPGLIDFFFPNATVEAEDISPITSKQWFHRRVFDIYLWHEGG